MEELKNYCYMTPVFPLEGLYNPRTLWFLLKSAWVSKNKIK